jgi:hypothetical protein
MDALVAAKISLRPAPKWFDRQGRDDMGSQGS